MGIFDKVKAVGKEVGIGLNAQEQYQRAYEKGVLLQPPDYSAATKHFAKASEMFLQEGDEDMARLAKANAALYELIDKRNLNTLREVIRALEPITEVPCIGSQDEMMQTSLLIAELRSLQCEERAKQCGNYADMTQEYMEAAEGFMKLGYAPLHISERLKLDGPVEKAILRAFYCEGLSDYYSALSVVLSSPVQAHDQMQKAASCFRQAMVTDWSKTVDDYIAKVSSKSHCWMCGREMQGEDVFFKYYPAETEEYHSQLLESSNEDLRMIDNTGHVTVCTVCGSAIENQADRYATMRADEVRAWADQLFQQTNEVLMNHSERLRSLERVAHRH
jgi:predicted nucleic acid-binding Zn ribbon protein